MELPHRRRAAGISAPATLQNPSGQHGSSDPEHTEVDRRLQCGVAPAGEFCTALASQQLQFDFTSGAAGEVVPLHKAGASAPPRNPQPPIAPTAGEIVILPRDRLAWHKQLADDHELSATQVRVGVGSHFNNKTGRTFVGLMKIAEEADCSRRTAWEAIRQLARRGHLNVTSGGGRHAGSTADAPRGRANEYSVILKTMQSVAPYSRAKTVQSSVGNGAVGCTPTLKSELKEGSSHDETDRRSSEFKTARPVKSGLHARLAASVRRQAGAD